MTSPFEMQLLWATLHQRGRALLNRLSAAAANAELLEETASREGAAIEIRAGLEALRGELTEAARHTRGLVDSLVAQLPTSSSAELDGALRDTLAPLRRHIARRETTIHEPAIAAEIRVAVEPELLRAAIAASLAVLLASALPGETIRIEHTSSATHEALSLALETRGAAPDVALEGELASLSAWLEGRGGILAVSKTRGKVIMTIDLPKDRGTHGC